jgi:glycine dehydrogenase
MIAIKGEIAKVGSGDWPREDNPLVNAPHTALCLTEKWAYPYTLAEAAYPDGVNPAAKYWPPVRRIDGAYGDRNLVCACPPVAAYA